MSIICYFVYQDYFVIYSSLAAVAVVQRSNLVAIEWYLLYNSMHSIIIIVQQICLMIDNDKKPARNQTCKVM